MSNFPPSKKMYCTAMRRPNPLSFGTMHCGSFWGFGVTQIYFFLFSARIIFLTMCVTRSILPNTAINAKGNTTDGKDILWVTFFRSTSVICCETRVGDKLLNSCKSVLLVINITAQQKSLKRPIKTQIC